MRKQLKKLKTSKGIDRKSNIIAIKFYRKKSIIFYNNDPNESLGIISQLYNIIEINIRNIFISLNSSSLRFVSRRIFLYLFFHTDLRYCNVT